MNTKLKNTVKGFTLLELVIVVAIIAILAAIAVPNMAEMMKTSKLRDANSQAQVVYMAAQDYLTYLETHGADADDMKNYFGDVSGIGYIGIDHSGGATVEQAEVKQVGTGAIGTEAHAAAQAIQDRLGAHFEGAWMVQVYPKTYTVKCAVYSNVPATGTGDTNYNWSAVSAIGGPSGTLYTAMSGKNYGTQQYDYYSDSDNAYTGQYPVEAVK